MTNDYIKEHPNQMVPDLSKDTNLTKEAHALLDNPDSWRQPFRDPSKFADALGHAERTGLNKNSDSIITPAEMYEFINDPSKDTDARKAVEIMHELYPAKVPASAVDKLRYECEMGMIPGARDPKFADKMAEPAKKDIEKHVGKAGALAGMGALAVAAATANPEAGLFSGIAAAGAYILKMLPADIEKNKEVRSHAKTAIQSGNLFQLLDLFDPKETKLLGFDEYIKTHGS